MPRTRRGVSEQCKRVPSHGRANKTLPVQMGGEDGVSGRPGSFFPFLGRDEIGNDAQSHSTSPADEEGGEMSVRSGSIVLLFGTANIKQEQGPRGG